MHRLKYVTFLIVAKLTDCVPSIIDLRIPKKDDQPTFNGNSYIFLNDYMANAHINYCNNVKPEPEDKIENVDLTSASKCLWENHQNMNLQTIAHSQPALKSALARSVPMELHKQRSLHTTMRNLLSTNSYPSGMLSNTPTLYATPTMITRPPTVLPSTRTILGTNGSVQRLETNPRTANLRTGHYDLNPSANRDTPPPRTRDPFLRRDLTREFQEMVQSFDLLQHGELMAYFIVKLLKNKQLESLWKALGILLRITPYKLALQILHKKRSDLRHGNPADVDRVCREVMKGSNFQVPAALFLSEFMEWNAGEVCYYLFVCLL